jgi:hypothetical protein
MSPDSLGLKSGVSTVDSRGGEENRLPSLASLLSIRIPREHPSDSISPRDTQNSRPERRRMTSFLGGGKADLLGDGVDEAADLVEVEDDLVNRKGNRNRILDRGGGDL